jgi:spore germination protein KC
MKNGKFIFLMIIVFLNSIIASSCWNYREIDKLAIVAGVAIDKEDNGNLSLTVEVVEFTGDKENVTTSKTITVEGKTIFDAARNAISLTGKRLYWSHDKIVIISRQMAEEGIIRVLDWFNRDSETRGDTKILISKANTAKEILQCPAKGTEIKSFELRQMLDNEKSLSKAPKVEMWEVINGLSHLGISATIPTIQMERSNSVFMPQIMGSAVFNQDKLIGFLDGDETMDMLFVQNEVKGGMLAQVETEKGENIPISLEIFSSKTKIKPLIEDNNIKFNVSINTTVAIDEIGGTVNYMKEAKKKELELSIAKTTKNRIDRLIKKVQTEYSEDIFGFGVKLNENDPKTWKSIKNQWGNKFKYCEVNVEVNIHIRNSSMLSKPIEEGD